MMSGNKVIDDNIAFAFLLCVPVKSFFCTIPCVTGHDPYSMRILYTCQHIPFSRDKETAATIPEWRLFLSTVAVMVS